MSKDLEAMVVRLVRARDARIAAKAIYGELAERLGTCLQATSQEGPCYYAHRLRPVEPCEVCQLKIPAWNARQAAAKEAGAALRVLVNAGRRLMPVAENEEAR